jgi:predicted AAA+ superfamily ATPase
MGYHPRAIQDTISSLVERHPVVVLTGARQTGKTTLLARLFQAPEWKTISLDDMDQLELARSSPNDLLAASTGVVVDEAQLAPGLRVLRDEYPEIFSTGILLHTGHNVTTLGDRILALPMGSLVL